MDCRADRRVIVGVSRLSRRYFERPMIRVGNDLASCATRHRRRPITADSEQTEGEGSPTIS